MSLIKRQYWDRLGIRAKAIITQIIMIVVPVFVCTVLIVNQITAENRSDTAVASYQYCRYIIQSLDTSIRQMESMANTLAGNKNVRNYVAMEPGAEQDESFQEHVYGLLIYAYNRYLPTHDIQILPRTTLNEIDVSGQITHTRSMNRLWTFDTSDVHQPQLRFYYQFNGDQPWQGVLVFSPSQNMIVDSAATISSILKQSCAVFFTDGSPLYIPDNVDDKEQDLLSKLAMDSAEGYTTLNDHQIGYSLRCETLPLIFVSTQQLGSVQLQGDRLLVLLLFCLTLVIGCVSFSYQIFFKGIALRIINLSHDCESLELDKLGKGDDQLAVPVRGNDEIGRLSVSINDMLMRITELTRLNEREVMISQRVAYDMLAAQIHPHFIYNILENLRMMAEINDDIQVADMLYVLGRMLRLSISDASSTGEIRTEMEHAQLYLQLQQMRMHGSLHYEIEQPTEEIAGIRCPRFLLQPIVENAIKHGFQKRKAPGRILVSSGVYERGVYLRVTDDGAGFTPERLQEIHEALKKNMPISNTRGGIGLMNVNTRLRMFYGAEAGLTLESSPEKGTVCTLWLVFKEQDPNAAEATDSLPESDPYTS